MLKDKELRIKELSVLLEQYPLDTHPYTFYQQKMGCCADTISRYIKELGMTNKRVYVEGVRSKPTITLSDDEEQLVIGSLLGDGYITIHTQKWVNSKLVIRHSEKQEAYIRQKQKLITSTTSSLRFYYNIDKREGWKDSRCFDLLSANNKVFNQYRNNWYIDGIKHVYKPDVDKLNPLGLSIWFQDDGCRLNNTVGLATMCFSLEDVQYLQKVLKNKFNIETSMQKTKNIRVLQRSFEAFKTLVHPYMNHDLLYKLGAGKTP